MGEIGFGYEDLSYEKMLDLCYAPNANPVSVCMGAWNQRARLERKPAIKTFYGYDNSSSNNFSNQYSAKLYDWLNQRSELYRLFRKTTYQKEGDSFRTLSALGNGGSGNAAYVTDENDTFPNGYEDTVFEVDAIDFGILAVSREETLKHGLRAGIHTRNNPAPTWKEIRDIAMNEWIAKIDAELGSDGDTAYDAGSFESLDRHITDSVEADGSSFWSSTDDSHRYSKSALGADAATYLESHINLPSTASNRNYDPEYLDDVLSDMFLYTPVESRNKVVIVTKGDAINEMKKYGSSKEWQQTIQRRKYSVNGGLETYDGDNQGFNVATYTGGGFSDIPIIRADNVHAESSGVGNIYCINTDFMELRMILPPVWLETSFDKDMVLRGLAQREGVAIGAGQLICTNYLVQGAVKYLSAA